MKRLIEILNARYLIAPEVLDNYIPIAIAFLNGMKIDFSAEEKPVEGKIIPFNPKTGQISISDQYDLANGSAEPNSVAYIPIQNEILSWRTEQIMQLIDLANADPNIVSILFDINTPGGMVTFTDLAAAKIKNSPKPTVGYVRNMIASAGMWIGSAMDYRIASGPLDRAGSIGTMARVMDMTRMYRDKLGIDVQDVYASKSTDKNGWYRAFFNQDLSEEERQQLLIEDLNFVNDHFHQAIINNLGIASDSEVLTGKMYYAEKAAELGLLNDIQSFEYAVNYAHKLGVGNSIKSQINSQNKN